jgi:hypothetical protein
MDVFTVCDDPQQAADIIINFRDSGLKSGIQEPAGLKKQENGKFLQQDQK